MRMRPDPLVHPGYCPLFLWLTWPFSLSPASLRLRWTSCPHLSSSGATATRPLCTLHTESTCECRTAHLPTQAPRCRSPCSPTMRLLVLRREDDSELCACRACVVLGVVFILSSLCILGKAVHNLVTRRPPEVVRHTHTYTHTESIYSFPL